MTAKARLSPQEETKVRRAAPVTTARRRRWWEGRAERSELAWVPRYRVLVPTGAQGSSAQEAEEFSAQGLRVQGLWEVWLCGLDGSLCERPGPVAEHGLERLESVREGSALEVPSLLDAASAAARARGHLVRSAHVLRLEAGLTEQAEVVEEWWFPVHLEIFRRWGRWNLRADDAVGGRKVASQQLRALLDALIEVSAE